MSRDYKTKMKYFEAEPDELKRRYAAIGVHNYEYKCKLILILFDMDIVCLPNSTLVYFIIILIIVYDCFV